MITVDDFWRAEERAPDPAERMRARELQKRGVTMRGSMRGRTQYSARSVARTTDRGPAALRGLGCLHCTSWFAHQDYDEGHAACVAQ